LLKSCPTHTDRPLKTRSASARTTLLPAILTGFALAFARAVGEYGSVIFIAGNIPFVSEIAPLLIVIKLEKFNYAGATVIASAMLGIAFAIIFLINLIPALQRRRFGQ
jgi:sulfate/thiosulfate transport system permease protein